MSPTLCLLPIRGAASSGQVTAVAPLWIRQNSDNFQWEE